MCYKMKDSQILMKLKKKKNWHGKSIEIGKDERKAIEWNPTLERLCESNLYKGDIYIYNENKNLKTIFK